MKKEFVKWAYVYWKNGYKGYVLSALYKTKKEAEHYRKNHEEEAFIVSKVQRVSLEIDV